jgi:hypothetical protein
LAARSQASRVLVSRSIVKRVGTTVERITFQVETTIPIDVDAGDYLIDLDGIVSNNLRRAVSVSTTSAYATPESEERVERASTLAQNQPSKILQSADEIDETISTLTGEVLGHVSFRDNTLVVSLRDDLELKYERGPVQGFLVPRVLDAMQRLEELQGYEFDVTNDGYLLGIQIEFPCGMAEATALKRVRRLIGAITWTLRALNAQ